MRSRRRRRHGDLFANLIGILSESGRIDEASAVAREALPILRRTKYTYVEEWVYLFWRRGQDDVARGCSARRTPNGRASARRTRRMNAA